MKIYLAADHAGFKLKESVKNYFLDKGLDVEDCGAHELNPDDDYPDFIAKAAEAVSNDPLSRAFVFGKSGEGEAIVANKFKNVRAVIGFSSENVKLAREHNDANILSLGADFVSEDKAREMTDIFINTPFSNEERHVRRISKISLIENK